MHIYKNPLNLQKLSSFPILAKPVSILHSLYSVKSTLGWFLFLQIAQIGRPILEKIVILHFYDSGMCLQANPHQNEESFYSNQQ